MAAEVQNPLQRIISKLESIDEPTFNEYVNDLESFKEYLLKHGIEPVNKTGEQQLSKIDYTTDFKEKISLLAVKIDNYFKANTKESGQYDRIIEGTVEMAFILLYFPFIEDEFLNLYVSLFMNFIKFNRLKIELSRRKAAAESEPNCSAYLKLLEDIEVTKVILETNTTTTLPIVKGYTEVHSVDAKQRDVKHAEELVKQQGFLERTISRLFPQTALLTAPSAAPLAAPSAAPLAAPLAVPPIAPKLSPNGIKYLKYRLKYIKLKQELANNN